MYDEQITVETDLSELREVRVFGKMIDGEHRQTVLELKTDRATFVSNELLVSEPRKSDLLHLDATVYAKLVDFRPTEPEATLQCDGVDVFKDAELQAVLNTLHKDGWVEDPESRSGHAWITTVHIVIRQRCMPLTEQEKDFECEQLSARGTENDID